MEEIAHITGLQINTAKVNFFIKKQGFYLEIPV